MPNQSEELQSQIVNEDDPSRLAYLVAVSLLFRSSVAERQEILALNSVREKLARLAEILTAAAAAIIFATLYFSNGHDAADDASPRAMVWQTNALMPPPASRDDGSEEVVAVAEWIANDLSLESQ